ncbi:unnamed protein product [Rhizopus stolonifer]
MTPEEPGVLHDDTLSARLEKSIPVRSHVYDVCVNSCKMFQKDDALTTKCIHCHEHRYKHEGQQVPRATFKMMSVSDQIAMALSNKKTREHMLYRHNYEKKKVCIEILTTEKGTKACWSVGTSKESMT